MFHSKIITVESQESVLLLTKSYRFTDVTLRSEQRTVAAIFCLQKIFSEIEKKEFDGLVPYNDGLQALPRLQDVMGVINRIRF